jgi:ATP/maltotriose-dependent transcriptional regulator MalT
VTTITAPVGAGKTTLVADWFQHTQRSAAWLSLDEADNEPASFLARFAAALRLSDGMSERDNLPSVSAVPPTSLETQLAQLVRSLGTRPDTWVLVMDNMHEVTAPAVRALIGELIKHQPPQLHLICLSREQLPLPTARLRAAGLLTELRFADLAFSADETARYLRQSYGLALDPTEIDVLQEQTEGWIAGVQLAALALKGGANVATSVTSFGGSHRHVVDYFAQEVLQQMPPHLQAFLRQTATLERLSAEVCDATTGRVDSGMCLRQLEQINLFVIPLDDQRQWYRYHRMFAAFLRATAEQGDVSVLQEQANTIGGAHRPELGDEKLAVLTTACDVRPVALGLSQRVPPDVWLWLFRLFANVCDDWQDAETIPFVAMVGLLRLRGPVDRPKARGQLAMQRLAGDDSVELRDHDADADGHQALIDSDPAHVPLADGLIAELSAAARSRAIGAEDDGWAHGEPLSQREREILRLIGQGKTNEAIADELIIAPGTVKKHLDNIYGKLGVHNRAAAVAHAHTRELL